MVIYLKSTTDISHSYHWFNLFASPSNELDFLASVCSPPPTGQSLKINTAPQKVRPDMPDSNIKMYDRAQSKGLKGRLSFKLPDKMPLRYV